MDGLSWWGIFWKIELPLAKPIVISNFLFGFIAGYNDWLGPTLYLNTNSDMKTLQQMIAMLNDTFGTKWGVQMAGSCLALIPSLIIFILCQKYFIEGVSLTGGKDV
jgi:multiple sugar transport system permease protein